MRTALCAQLGIEHPIVGFSPSEHVVAAISRAGGLGVLGCVRFNDPDQLDATLTWLDQQVQMERGGLTMAGHVGECLLHHAEQRLLEWEGEVSVPLHLT